MSLLLKEFYSMLRAYLKGHYPLFIYKTGKVHNFIPLFYFHDVSPSEFEYYLAYLRRNDYKAVTCDDVIESLQHNHAHHTNEIVLTFDDGLSSFYAHIFPLLRKYRVRAVAYVVPSWIGSPGFLTWQQCQEMYDSGLVDIQSHSNTHPKVITGLRINGITSVSDGNTLPWDIPGLDVTKSSHNSNFYPFFQGHSLFESTSAYVLPDSFWNECTYIQRNNKKISISGRAQRKRLKRIFHRILQRHVANIEVKNKTDILKAIRNELLTSREVIEENVKGHNVLHFAFPWHTHSLHSWTVLEQVGYLSGAVGLRSSDSCESTATSPIKLFRVNGDFLPCLPGEGRKGFFQVVTRKIIRRLLSISKKNIENHARSYS